MKDYEKMLQIGVVGSYGTLEYDKNLDIYAKRIGELLAKESVAILCGGDDSGGLIESVIRGAKENNGIVIGFLTGIDKYTTTKGVDICIPCGAESYGLREYLLVIACDSIIIINGGSGTLNEAAVAYQNTIPMVALQNSGGWSTKLANTYLDKRKKILIEAESTPEKVVEKAIELAKKGRR